MKPVMNTFTGKTINPLDFKMGDVDLRDISHGLALCNRFAGQTKRPISVAQHSVFCSRLCDGTGYEVQALLHDSSEAIVADIVKWVKETPEMAPYRAIEERIQNTVYDKFGCERKMAGVVEEADRIMVRFEGMKGFGKSFKIDHPNYPPLTNEEVARIGSWGFWSWQQSEQSFLDRAKLLGLM